MRQHLYISALNASHAERWLADKKPPAASVLPICESNTLESARALREKFPALAEPLLLENVQADASGQIIVPSKLDSVLMRYQFRVEHPKIAPHYPLIEKLWRAGFRHFTLYSGDMEQTFEFPHLVEEFKDRHKGERCFVVGNGPSLQQLDMTLLKNEITFGANRCYLGYDKWGYGFTYWGLYDQYQVEIHHAEYEENIPADTVKFFPFEYLPILNFENACPVEIVRSRAAHAFLPGGNAIHNGYTVSYMLLQIAAYMGCNPIYLIGMDHRYDLKRSPFNEGLRRMRRWGVRQLRDTLIYDAAFALQQKRLRAMPEEKWRERHALWGKADTKADTHFDSRYTAGDAKKFAPPEPAEAERDFACAHAWALKNGVEILNATPDSALDAFPSAYYKELFKNT